MASIDPVQLPIIQEKPPSGPAKSRMSKRRFLVLLCVQGLIIAHVVQWLIMGSTITPVEPSEAMETVKEGVITFGTLLFLGAILSTMIFGRFFCGWGCHIILLQDFCTVLLKKMKIRPRPFRSRLLLWMPLGLATYMFVWPLVHRFAIAPWFQEVEPWPGFTWGLTTTTDFWRTFPGLAMSIPFLLICGFLTVYVLGMKGYCTYACPYGGFFAPAEQISPVRIRVNDSCEQCGHCTAVCTSNVRVHEEVNTYGMVVDQGCMKCMDCVSVCPNDALYLGIGKPAVGLSPEERNAGPKTKYDLSWPEEIVFAILAVIVLVSMRGAYSLPLLFASGVTAVVVWGLWKSWKVIRKRSVTFQKTYLKREGSICLPGYAFVGASLFFFAVILYTGAVNFMALRAQQFDDKVLIPSYVVFTVNGVMPPEEVVANARESIAWYERADYIGRGGWSIFPSKTIDFAWRKSWLLSVLREFENAEKQYQVVIEEKGFDEDVAIAGGRLRLMIDPQGAEQWYETVLSACPDWSRLRDDRILTRIDRMQFKEAIEEARIGLAATPSDLLVMRRLATLLIEYGTSPEDWKESARITLETLEIEPENPGAWRALALAQVKSGDMISAKKSLQESVVLLPNNYRIRTELSLLLNDLGKRKEAEVEMAEARRLWDEQGKVGTEPMLPEPQMGPMRP